MRFRRPVCSAPLAKARCVSAWAFPSRAGGRTDGACHPDGGGVDSSSWIRWAFRDAGGANGSTAAASSHTVWNRSAGLLARQRATTRSSPSGTAGCQRRIGGGSAVSTWAQMSWAVSPSKGTRPVSSSYSEMPSDQMSLRQSTSRDARTCSGDM